jgi:TolB-like protein
LAASCPSDSTLDALLLGHLDPRHAGEVRGHLDTCIDCRGLVEEVTRSLAASPPPRPAPWQIGRYRVLGELGAGAMGRVYEALDRQLGRRVALKLLRPDVADEGLRAALGARLLGEAEAMARLAHPNVVAVHDAGTHEGAVFLVMELVQGQTLQAWLSDAPRSPAAIVSAFLQAGAGLLAAHAAGLVHGDFKPANVLCGEDGRVRVGDFGLARAAAEQAVGLAPHCDAAATEGDQARITRPPAARESTAAGGTPRYMAPEQLLGRQVDARTDQFAFCVALYESLYGTHPYGDGLLAEQLAARLAGRPRRPPRRAGVSARVTRALERGLDPEPDHRFATMAALLEQLGPARRGAARRRFAVGVIATVAAAGAVATPLAVRRHARQAAERGARVAGALTGAGVTEHAVAILPLHNLTGSADQAWRGAALTEMLTTEVAAQSAWRVISAERVARARTARGAELDGADLARAVGAEWVVAGSYTILGHGAATPGTLRVDLRLEEPTTGRVRGHLAEEGDAAQLADLARVCGARLRILLGGSDPPGGLAPARFLPSRPDALHAYIDGIAASRTDDLVAAERLLERAVAMEPENPLAHSWLARIELALGAQVRAQTESARAVERSTGLPPGQRLALEYLDHKTHNRFDQAIAAARARLQLSPGDPDATADLATAQTRAGRGADALKTLAPLHERPHAPFEAAGLGLAEADAAMSVNDYAHAEPVARAALAQAEVAGSRALAAHAHAYLGLIAERLGRRDETQRERALARGLFLEVGQRVRAATESVNLSTIETEAGQLDEAVRHAEEALAIFREVGNRSFEATTLLQLSAVVDHQGEIARAANLARQSATTFRAVGDEGGEVTALSSLTYMALELGRLAEARTVAERALMLARKTQGEEALGRAQGALAAALVAAGELARGSELLSEAIAIARRAHDPEAVGFLAISLAEIERARGTSSQAAALLREAIAGASEVDAIELRAALAQDELEGGHPERAEAAARQVLAWGQAHRSREAVLLGRPVLARALVARGQVAEASALVAGLPPAPGMLTRVEFALARSSIDEALGRLGPARQDLEAARAESARAGFRLAELRLAVAQGELDAQAAPGPASQRRLWRLAERAEAQGMAGLARSARAQATAGSPAQP